MVYPAGSVEVESSAVRSSMICQSVNIEYALPHIMPTCCYAARADTYAHQGYHDSMLPLGRMGFAPASSRSPGQSQRHSSRLAVDNCPADASHQTLAHINRHIC